MRCEISKSHDLKEILETTATLDYAFIRVAELSSADLATVYVAWHWDRDAVGQVERRCRAFGRAGRARWAKACMAKLPPGANTHWGCTVCGGLGLVADR
jgi:2-methylisocitrate lyase-like PEP mutase family enzyme